MIRTLYNPEVEKKTRIKDAENFLKLGVSEEIISQGTGIPIEEVRKMKEDLLIKSEI